MPSNARPRREWFALPVAALRSSSCEILEEERPIVLTGAPGAMRWRLVADDADRPHEGAKQSWTYRPAKLAGRCSVSSHCVGRHGEPELVVGIILVMIGFAGFIPSPRDGLVRIGPLPLHAYGLMLALGVLAAVKIAERRWRARGGDPQAIAAIAVPVVIGGLVGARLYHLFTGYDWTKGGLLGTVKVWQGGLSIWGAVLGGLIALVVVARRRHLNLVGLMDAIGPAVVVAQAIGRFGNYFNQELFGRPTTLPWGLEIDVAHRPAGYAQYATFHPTFLYESAWCLVVFTTIVFAERQFRLRRGQAFAMYVCLYTLGRTWFEAMRIDKATRVFGIRFNLLVSAVICVSAAVVFMVLQRRGPADVDDETNRAEAPTMVDG